MTIKNDPIKPLLQKAREEGYTELVVIANQYPSLLKPKQGGGLVHDVLTDHEPISNISIRDYLLSVTIKDGGVRGYHQEDGVGIHVETDALLRLSVSFTLPGVDARLAQVDADETITLLEMLGS